MQRRATNLRDVMQAALTTPLGDCPDGEAAAVTRARADLLEAAVRRDAAGARAAADRARGELECFVDGEAARAPAAHPATLATLAAIAILTRDQDLARRVAAPLAEAADDARADAGIVTVREALDERRRAWRHEVPAAAMPVPTPAPGPVASIRAPDVVAIEAPPEAPAESPHAGIGQPAPNAERVALTAPLEPDRASSRSEVRAPRLALLDEPCSERVPHRPEAPDPTRGDSVPATTSADGAELALALGGFLASTLLTAAAILLPVVLDERTILPGRFANAHHLVVAAFLLLSVISAESLTRRLGDLRPEPVRVDGQRTSSRRAD